MLKVLEACHIVWDVQGVPRHVRDQTAAPGRARLDVDVEADEGTSAAA